ncbi:elongation factor 1-gamma, partial [Leucoraja erinacea]|uniref:elongation factor 1-gamma n=1 Tax=Leucoraja erinaceus TaxID=7782 RepID=UPI002456C9C5
MVIPAMAAPCHAPPPPLRQTRGRVCDSPSSLSLALIMAAGTLYTYPDNWRAFKAMVAAQYSGCSLRVDTGFVLGQSNRSPAFLAKFPLGKVPAFEGDDGFCVFESNAIAYYVADVDLRGTTREAEAQVLQWVCFADSHVIPPASTWVFPTLGIMQYNKQATEHAKEELKKVLGILDEHLKTRTFLVGERVTLADITLVCSLLWLYKQVLEPSFRQSFTNTNRWFVTCVNQPQFKAVLGQVNLCDKMAQFDAKKFADMQPRKEKAPKDAKDPKPQEKKKKEEKKPAAAAAPEDEPDATDEVLSTEPKTQDPFAHLPKRFGDPSLCDAPCVKS